MPTRLDKRRRIRRPPGRPAAEKRPEVRDALLDAASRLFARRGVAGTSLRQVASEAGVTPAMVNYYFGGKQGLHDAILERTLARILERARAVAARHLDRPATAGEQLADLLAVLVDNFRAEPWLPVLVVREVLTEGGRLRERFIRDYAQHMAALLPSLMQREIAAGRFRGDLDAQLAFLSFMGMTLMPFVARPVVERVLGVEYDEGFLGRFVAHTKRLFLEGVLA